MALALMNHQHQQKERHMSHNWRINHCPHSRYYSRPGGDDDDAGEVRQDQLGAGH